MTLSSLRKNIITIVIASILLTTMMFLLLHREEQEENVPNIFLLSLSGVRNSESIDDPTHQYIPNLWNSMFKEGTVYTNLVDLNYERHMPTVQCVNTGMTYLCDHINPLKTPTIFDYVKKKYHLPNTKMWSIGHFFINHTKYDRDASYPIELGIHEFDPGKKDVKILQRILSPSEKKYLRDYTEVSSKLNSWPLWDSISDIYYSFFKKILAEYKPALVHYMQSDVESGHYSTYACYVIGLLEIDKRIYEIWKMLQADDHYRDNTYLIVYIDHNRDPYYMQHDNNAYDNPSKVWMYIYGPDIKKGGVIDRPINHMDIFATAAHIMRVETHETDGRVLKDCFSIERNLSQ